MVKKLVFGAILLAQVPLWADPPAPQTPAAAPAVPAMNEMSGAVLSVDTDAKVIRLTLDGGYNVEFSYDSQTLIRNGGHDITVNDLSYGDQVTVRYIGRDLIAREIDRTRKAPAPNLPQPVPTTSQGQPLPPQSSSAPAEPATPPVAQTAGQGSAVGAVPPLQGGGRDAAPALSTPTVSQ